ncbi:hypothetical protein [Steroidobacter agaridevorans]|uniref:hypothetical protein n=1 Tax=Steroidobacter agaridevorans TaxID=2695856 RepID=UPI00137A4FF0|nr:hypothetical protein [Steroidobacter agaridevorans]
MEGRPQSFEALRPLDAKEVTIQKLSDGMYEASIAFPTDASEPCAAVPSFIAAFGNDATRAELTQRLGSASFTPHSFSASALAREDVLPTRPLTPPSMCAARCFTLPADARPIRMDLHEATRDRICATLPNERNQSFQSEREHCADGSSWHEVVSRPGFAGTWVVCAVSASSQARASTLVVRYKLLHVRQIG